MAKWPVFCLKSKRLKTWEIIVRLWPNQYRSTPKQSKSKKPHETGLNVPKKIQTIQKSCQNGQKLSVFLLPIQTAENINHIRIVAVLVQIDSETTLEFVDAKNRTENGPGRKTRFSKVEKAAILGNIRFFISDKRILIENDMARMPFPHYIKQNKKNPQVLTSFFRFLAQWLVFVAHRDKLQ